MQNTLEELLRLQRAAVPANQSLLSNGAATIPSHLTAVRTAPHATPTLHQMYPQREISTPHSAVGLDLYHPNAKLQSGGPSPLPGARNTVEPQFVQQDPSDDYRQSLDKRPRSPIRGGPSDEEEAEHLSSNRHMRDWDNMFYLAEAARLEQDGHLAPGDDSLDPSLRSTGQSQDVSSRSESTGPASKRRKSNNPALEDEFAELKRHLPLQRGDHVSRFKDCIDLGFCDVATARRMFDVFMEGCLVYMPCFDPEVDTFESLRKRSPFAITVLVMVGAKVTDAGGAVSELQQKCKEHAEHIGMSTLFSPVARIEVVQAMIILASWGDTSWRPGGHALRMAMDMGLYRCLPLLVQAGMGKGKSADELKEDYQLVVGARVWLTLYKVEFEWVYLDLRSLLRR